MAPLAVFCVRPHLPIAEATPIHEQLLSLFPTAAKFWKQYVEAHMAANNDDATKQIFSRCLLICLQIPLWRCYITFIRKVNEKKGVEDQEETRKAFDFMLNYMVFEAGLKRFMHEPVYILQYADFLTRLNDDQDIRALFERALSSLPPDESIESDLPTAQSGKIGTPAQLPTGPAPSTSEISVPSKSHPMPSASYFKPSNRRQHLKRKELDRQEDDDTRTVQSQPLPQDAFSDTTVPES